MVRRVPAGVPGVRASRLWLSLLAVAIIFARLPLIADPIDVRPDGAEYLGIARHLAWEGEWVSDIRWHFASAGPVRHPALGDRPPLYPLALVPLVRLSRDPAVQVYAARLFNALLAALAAVLAWALFAPEFGASVAWAAVLLFSLLPQNLRYGSQPLSEMLFLVLLVVALLAWRGAGRGGGAEEWKRGRGEEPREGSPSGSSPPPFFHSSTQCRAALAGCLLGLCALTHAAGLFPLAALLGSCWLPAGRRAGGIRKTAWLLAGFATMMTPYWAALWWAHGTPFYSALRLNFSVAHIHDAIYRGYEQALPSPLAFVAENPARVARLIAGQAKTVFGTLAETLRYLLPFLLLARRADFRGARGLYLAIALAFATGHSLAWVTWGAARYLLPADLLLLPVLLAIPLARRSDAYPPGDRSSTFTLALIVGLAWMEVLPAAWRSNGGAWWEARWAWLGLPALAGTALLVTACLSRFHSFTLPLFHSASPRRRLTALWLVGVALTAASEARLVARLYVEKERSDRGFPDTALKREAVTWLRANAAPGALIATDDPWLLNLLTGHPAVVFPWVRDAAQARRFLAEFRPRYVILVVADPPGQPPRESELARRLFGAVPVPGPVASLAPLAWRLVVVRRGSAAGQQLLILAPDEHATPAALSPERRPLSRHAAATPHLRMALPADDRGVPPGQPALRRLPDPGGRGSGRAGGAAPRRHRGRDPLRAAAA